MIKQKRLPFLSLLMTLSALVFFSCSTPPKKPEEPPARPTTAVWEISPADGYYDEASGYVQLTFTPPEELTPIIASKAAKDRGARPGRMPKNPPGGRLTVHLGYKRLTFANTIWYSFEVHRGQQLLVQVDGEDMIPNIKGMDGNWWNVVDLDLDEPVATSVQVTVFDKRLGVDYPFTLRKVLAEE